jgi:ABC-type methionine transport system ATPase subunit
MTVVLVTHEPDVARNARRLLEIRDGRLVRDAATSALQGEPKAAPRRRLPVRANWRRAT